MADYIDREELLEKIVNVPSKVTEKTFYDKEVDLLTGSAYRQNEIEDIVNDMPTVEQKHGHWIYKQLDNYKKYSVTCSVCGAEYIDNYDGYITAENFNGCPNCLAKMDEVTEDE